MTDWRTDLAAVVATRDKAFKEYRWEQYEEPDHCPPEKREHYAKRRSDAIDAWWAADRAYHAMRAQLNAEHGKRVVDVEIAKLFPRRTRCS